jgi:hypothetical protein
MSYEISTTIRGTYCDYSARFSCSIKLICDVLIVTDVDLVELDHIDATTGKCTVVEICPDNGTQRERDHYRAAAQAVLEGDRYQWQQVVEQIERAAYENAQLAKVG